MLCALVEDWFSGPDAAMWQWLSIGIPEIVGDGPFVVKTQNPCQPDASGTRAL